MATVRCRCAVTRAARSASKGMPKALALVMPLLAAWTTAAATRNADQVSIASPLSLGPFCMSVVATPSPGTFTGGLDNSEARYSGGMLYVDCDGNGVADMQMLLVGAGAQVLGAADFLF